MRANDGQATADTRIRNTADCPSGANAQALCGPISALIRQTTASPPRLSTAAIRAIESAKEHCVQLGACMGEPTIPGCGLIAH